MEQIATRWSSTRKSAKWTRSKLEQRVNSQKKVEFGGLSPTAPAFHLAEHRVKSQKLMVLLRRSDLARAGARVELEMSLMVDPLILS